jgi:molecular chaperone GrpE
MSGDATPFPQDPAAAIGADSVDATTAAPEKSCPASEAPAEASDPAERVRQLEAELSSLQAEHETVRGQYMRIAADFDNFRKRQSRDQDDLRVQIACSTLSEILPVVDNFERARQQLDPQHEEAQALHRSYQGLYKQLVDVFKQLGVSPMRVEGEPFDPNLHEAVLREPSDDHVEDVVIAELQRGYHLNGRVLRHALVKVSMGPGPSGGAAAAPPVGDAPAEHEA